MTTEISFNIISVKEFSRKIKKPSSTIYEWIRKHIIPESCIKRVGKTIFIKVPEIMEFFNS